MKTIMSLMYKVYYFNFIVSIILIISLKIADQFQSNHLSIDRAALVDLYNSTNGDNWDNNSGWLNGDPSDSWYGVEVNSEGRVIRLDLRDNNLTGILNSTLGDLTELEYLNVKQNYIAGELPSSLGNLKSLRYLLLNHDKAGDPVPDKDVHPGKPNDRDRRSNNFSGTLPPEWGNLTNLEYLQLDGNSSLTGTIPSEWANMSSLIMLHLNYNPDLQGPLPSELGNLSNLVHLAIGYDGNPDRGYQGFVGTTIPESYGNLTNLRYLRLKALELDGDIDMFQSCTQLRTVFLEHNNFSGELPHWWNNGNFTQVSTLYLSWNNFTGTLFEVDNLGNLYDFQLNGNQLTGSIPQSFTSLEHIIIITMGWNNLTGELPEGIGTAYPNLRSIRVNNNNLTGPLPSEFSFSGGNLQSLYFSNNNFTSADATALKRVAVYSPNNVRIQNNQLTFKDFVPAIDSYSSGVFSYDDQGPFGSARSGTYSTGATITLDDFESVVTHPDNDYQWYRDGQAISGATARSLTISGAQASDAGSYTLRVTNPHVSGMTLTSQPIEITIN